MQGLIVTDVTPGGPAWEVLVDDPQRGGPDIIMSVEGKDGSHRSGAAEGAARREGSGSIVTLRIYNPRTQGRRVERVRLGDERVSAR